MGLGMLRLRVGVARPQRVQDGRGGFTTTWQALGTAAGQVAAVTRLPTDALQTALGQRPAYLVTLDARAGPAVQAGDRLTAGPHQYEVVAVQPTDRYLLCWGMRL